MSFKYCCEHPEFIEYSLFHTELSDDDVKKCASLLWYLPEIDSFQACHETPLTDDIYEDIFLDIIKEKLNLGEEDLKIDDSKSDHTIDYDDVKHYKDKICLNCSKIIIAKSKKKNRVISILVRFRNSIAHGYFNIINNVFIGFDHPKFNSEKYSGFMKVKMDNLVKLFDTLISINNLPSLFSYVLKKMGYSLYEPINYPFDIIIEKEGRRYYLDFKKFYGRYIDKNEILNYVEEKSEIDKSNCMFILIVDSSYQTNWISTYLRNHKIFIADKRIVKELISGKDIFKELNNLM